MTAHRRTTLILSLAIACAALLIDGGRLATHAAPTSTGSLCSGGSNDAMACGGDSECPGAPA